jgi:hypothetical protein
MNSRASLKKPSDKDIPLVYKAHIAVLPPNKAGSQTTFKQLADIRRPPDGRRCYIEMGRKQKAQKSHSRSNQINSTL